MTATADQSELLALKAEVERLTAKDAADPNSPWKIVQRQDEMIVKLDQEVERLREELVKIDTHNYVISGSIGPLYDVGFSAGWNCARRIAHETLNPTPEKPT